MNNNKTDQTKFKVFIENLSYRDCIAARKEIQRICSIGKATVSHWENGKSNPSKENAGKVADLLKCSVGDLFPKYQ